ncbi:MAG: hypothetical protein IJS57_02465 [Paludibacteraceae bacterium]|nr:hypothetical protein [Paludibacteraceae bacterium]
MTIEYNPADALVQSVIGLILQVKKIRVVSQSDEYVPNAETLEAIKDVKEGRVYHAKNTEDLFQQILG